ncbi:MAG: pyruvate formate lyase family protein, partial [Clostridiales bacterium]|nr:pyruvate formate lyase family protein [Clostridiales bacterium]
MFYSVCAQGRPVRLCEATRQFALESLNGKYGDEAMRHWAVSLDGVEGFEALSPMQQYDAAIREIARRAPLRVTPQERVCGAATLGAAIAHNVPATRGGKLAFLSISHLTLGFDRALKLGVNAMEREIRERAADPALDARQRAFLASLQNAVDALRVWHGRYLAATRETRPDLYKLLLRVPFEPPENFHQAVQALWFLFAFTRLCGNWPGIGRIDEMLGEFLRRDLASGALTREEAREILASLFIKGCEWIESETPTGSGDAQHYQNIVLGGLDETGREVTNAVSYLVVDIVEELAIGDFPITVRLNSSTPAPFKRRLAEAIRHGGGAIALYGEPLILDSLMRFGYSREEALRFANDGCWEVQIPGKTCFSYVPFDALAIFLHDTLRVDEETPLPYGDFEALYRAYLRDLGAKVDAICAGAIAARLETDGRGNFRWKEALPCGVVSLFEEGCVENARSYLEGGPRYTVISPHIGGAPDVGNSLLAIDRLVYREKRVTLDELRAILRANWEGHEPLRQYVL